MTERALAGGGPLLLGLDIGGGGGRCALVDPASGALVTAYRPWSFPVAPDTGGMGFDADCEGLLAQLGSAVREALERAGAEPRQVAGVAATSMRFGLVVTDADGAVLYAGPNRDARAAGEGLTLAAQHGEELAARTGLWPAPILASARLRWLLARPGRMARAARVLALSDWLAGRLCGEWVTDFSQAGCTGLFDPRTRDWAWDWIERLELPRELFPPVRAAGSPLGELRGDAAAALGLLPGTPVAVGGADTQCGLLGCAALEPGDVGLIAGTTAPLQLVLDAPRVDPSARLWAGLHARAERWVLESNAGAVGETLDWFARTSHPDAPAPVAALLAEADLAAPGAGGQLSTLGAQLFDARALSLPVGALTLSHLAADAGPAASAGLARALVEGLACALRANLEQIEECSGPVPGALRLGGGLARSPRFAALLANVTGRPVAQSRTPETSALGAAVCAGVAARVLDDLAAGARRLAGEPRTFAPDAALRERYDALYPEWRRLLDAEAPAREVAQGLAVRALLERSAGAAEPAAARPRPRILVTAALDDEALDALRELGDVEYESFRERMRLLSGDALVDALEGVDVLITEVDVVDADSVRRRPELRVVASCRGDAVNVDVPAMTALGVPVLNAPGRNADAVADLTLAFLLMLARKLPRAGEFLRQPDIEPGDMGKLGQAFGSLQGRELWRKRVGLVGLGAVGRKVAERLRPFGAQVLAFDPFVDAEQASLCGAEKTSLERLLAECDFVSLHAPVRDETRGLIGAAELERMKPGAFLVNTARAALVDEDALLEALKGGALAGAALDVFAVEPPGSGHPLLALDNVIATPHVGGNTVEVASHQGRIIADDLARLLAGGRPRHALNPEVLDGFDLARPRPEPDAARLAELAAAPGPAVSDLQRQPPRSPSAAPAPAPRSDVPRETVERVERLMRAFCERIAADEALRRFAQGRDVTLQFALSDLPCACWFRLRDGAVQAGTGEPDGEPEVQLKMRAFVFDGMFTGRVNAMEKAMSGELSFTGDAAKAMTLQQVQRDLNRLYRAAREAAGDPGDLASLPAPGGAAPAAPPSSAGDDVRPELVAVVNELYATQLITATGGNVSARVPGERALWITPSQMFKGDLSPELLVRIDADTGKPLDAGARSPSSERLMHCAAYRARPEAQAVIHAHAPHATILVNAGLPFLPISTEAAFFDDLPRIPFTMPGTPDLAERIEQALASSWAVLMQNHGILVAGRSLRRAADMAEIIERSSEVILGCYAVGKEPPVLPPDVVKTLREMGDLVA